MGTREDRWFEVWYSPGGDLRPQYDLLPTWMLIAVPDVEHPGHVLVFDPFNNNEIAFHGASYEEAVNWLCEDEYELAQGRMFPDDGFPIQTGGGVTANSLIAAPLRDIDSLRMIPREMETKQ